MERVFVAPIIVAFICDDQSGAPEDYMAEVMRDLLQKYNADAPFLDWQYARVNPGGVAIPEPLDRTIDEPMFQHQSAEESRESLKEEGVAINLAYADGILVEIQNQPTMPEDFNASANISAGITNNRPGFEPERMRRLRSLLISLDTIEQELKIVREMADLLKEEVSAEHYGYKRNTQDVLRLTTAGYVEKEDHWFVRQDGKYAIAMPNPPGSPKSSQHSKWGVYTWMKMEGDSDLDWDFVNRVGDTYDSAEAAIGAYRNVTIIDPREKLEGLGFHLSGHGEYVHHSNQIKIRPPKTFGLRWYEVWINNDAQPKIVSSWIHLGVDNYETPEELLTRVRQFLSDSSL